MGLMSLVWVETDVPSHFVLAFGLCRVCESNAKTKQDGSTTFWWKNISYILRFLMFIFVLCSKIKTLNQEEFKSMTFSDLTEFKNIITLELGESLIVSVSTKKLMIIFLSAWRHQIGTWKVNTSFHRTKIHI